MIFATPDAVPAVDVLCDSKKGLHLYLLTRRDGANPFGQPTLLSLGSVQKVAPLYNQLALLIVAGAVVGMKSAHPSILLGMAPGTWKAPKFNLPEHLTADRMLQSATFGGSEELAYQIGLNAYIGNMPIGCADVRGFKMASSALEELGSMIYGDHRNMLQFTSTYTNSLVARAKDGLRMLKMREMALPNQAQLEVFMDHLIDGTGLFTAQPFEVPPSA